MKAPMNMRRPIRTTATAFAMLALVAGGSIASGNAAAQDDSHLSAPCRAIWQYSEAYQTCGSRSDAEGDTAESIEAVGNDCRITTSCEYYRAISGMVQTKRRNTSWQSVWTKIHHLKNCDGELKLSC